MFKIIPCINSKTFNCLIVSLDLDKSVFYYFCIFKYDINMINYQIKNDLKQNHYSFITKIIISDKETIKKSQ